jgi:hypothetical protein
LVLALHQKSKENSGGFSWGYPMQRYLKTLSDLNGKKEPRLDIIMTLSIMSHLISLQKMYI